MNAPLLRIRAARRAALVVILVWISCGCAAPRPLKFYSLNTEFTPVSTSDPRFPVTILVARVRSSHLYRDDRLVYQSGPVLLGTYEFQRWAASPVDMVQELLISSLRSTGQYSSVAAMGSDARGDYILRSDLHALNETDRQPQIFAHVSIDLDLYDPRAGVTVWTGSYSHDEPVNGKAVPDVVIALDKNVRDGLQQLAASLTQYFAAHPPQVPGAKPSPR